MEATANDLRSRTKDLLDTVNRGEEVVITYHGKPCAKLVPYQEVEVRASRELFGYWKKKFGANCGEAMLMTVSTNPST